MKIWETLRNCVCFIHAGKCNIIIAINCYCGFWRGKLVLHAIFRYAANSNQSFFLTILFYLLDRPLWYLRSILNMQRILISFFTIWFDFLKILFLKSDEVFVFLIRWVQSIDLYLELINFPLWLLGNNNIGKVIKIIPEQDFSPDCVAVLGQLQQNWAYYRRFWYAAVAE